MKQRKFPYDYEAHLNGSNTYKYMICVILYVNKQYGILC